MIFQKAVYISEVSFRRVAAKKKLYTLIILSLSAAMIVPMVGIAVAEAAFREKNAVRGRYPDSTFACRLITPKIEDDIIAYISENICEASVTASLYDEYVIVRPDSPEFFGRFMDVVASDAKSVSIFYEKAGKQISEDFSDGRSVCVIDFGTAQKCGLKTGELLSIRGYDYEIAYIADERSDSFVCIPYSALPSKVSYQQTLYLFYGSAVTEKDVLSYMRRIFQKAERMEAVPITESYDTKDNEAYSTLFFAASLTLLYIICSGVNVSMIRRGEMSVNRHDYAVALALGCTHIELLTIIIFENLILIPPAMLTDAGLFFIITRAIPFPYRLSLTLINISCVFFLALVSSCVTAFAVTKRMPFSCASMLKER